jgi:hypothetical protein
MNILKSCCFFLLLISSSLYAKSEGHILSGSTMSSLRLSEDSWNHDYEPTLYIGLGYDYAFTSGLQVGGNLSTFLYSGGSYWRLSIGPTYNFNKDEIENSLFAGVKGGVNYSAYNGYSKTTSFARLEAGKRFKLFENVSYVPQVIVSKDLVENAPKADLSFEFFNFSILF